MLKFYCDKMKLVESEVQVAHAYREYLLKEPKNMTWKYWVELMKAFKGQQQVIVNVVFNKALSIGIINQECPKEGLKSRCKK